MLMAELTTAVANNLPVKIILLKNNSLAEVKFEQKEIGNPEYGCDLAPIDFVAFAKACGADGFRCAARRDPARHRRGAALTARGAGRGGRRCRREAGQAGRIEGLSVGPMAAQAIGRDRRASRNRVQTSSLR